MSQFIVEQIGEVANSIRDGESAAAVGAKANVLAEAFQRATEANLSRQADIEAAMGELEACCPKCSPDCGPECDPECAKTQGVGAEAPQIDVPQIIEIGKIIMSLLEFFRNWRNSNK